MTRQFQIQHRIPVQKKDKEWEMTTIDGRPIDEPIHLETLPLTMNFEHHLEDIIFDIYPTGAYDVILGLPWLRAHNPEISWDNEHIRFTRCDCNREKLLSAPVVITSYDW